MKTSKQCTKCKLTKNLSEFAKRNDRKVGYRADCKKCVNIRNKIYRDSDKEHTAKLKKESYERNKVKALSTMKKYRESNKEYFAEYNKKYQEENREAIVKQRHNYNIINKIDIAIRRKEYRKNNTEHIREKERKYNENNREKRNAFNKIYAIKNRDKILKNGRKYYAENSEKIKKYHSDLRATEDGRAYAISHSNKRRALKAGTAVNNTAHENYLIECIYVFSRFKSKSTGIAHHVDHKHPISKGGAHHPDNLQILTATENLQKGARVA